MLFGACFFGATRRGAGLAAAFPGFPAAGLSVVFTRRVAMPALSIPFVVKLSRNPFVVSLSNHAF
jgi:hypothetical protein